MARRLPVVVVFSCLVVVGVTSAAGMQDRRDGAFHSDDMAPDFTLAPRDGGPPITLSSFRGRQAVALVFGSYT